MGHNLFWIPPYRNYFFKYSLRFWQLLSSFEYWFLEFNWPIFIVNLRGPRTVISLQSSVLLKTNLKKTPWRKGYRGQSFTSLSSIKDSCSIIANWINNTYCFSGFLFSSNPASLLFLSAIYWHIYGEYKGRFTQNVVALHTVLILIAVLCKHALLDQSFALRLRF